jgi:hypothetical protein
VIQPQQFTREIYQVRSQPTPSRHVGVVQCRLHQHLEIQDAVTTMTCTLTLRKFKNVKHRKTRHKKGTPDLALPLPRRVKTRLIDHLEVNACFCHYHLLIIFVFSGVRDQSVESCT